MVNFTADSQSKMARKSRERADLANAGVLNRRYLTCQISAILYPDRGDWRISQSPHRAQLAIFADHRDRRIKSPGVSPALALLYVIASSVVKSQAKKFVFWWKTSISFVCKGTRMVALNAQKARVMKHAQSFCRCVLRALFQIKLLRHFVLLF